jgi:hypothetical protein
MQNGGWTVAESAGGDASKCITLQRPENARAADDSERESYNGRGANVLQFELTF